MILNLTSGVLPGDNSGKPQKVAHEVHWLDSGNTQNLSIHTLHNSMNTNASCSYIDPEPTFLAQVKADQQELHTIAYDLMGHYFMMPWGLCKLIGVCTDGRLEFAKATIKADIIKKVEQADCQ